MKKLLHTLLVIFCLVIFTTHTNGQAWQRDSRVLSLGFGASDFYHLDGYYYSGTGVNRTWYQPLTGQINFQGEFGVHKYVGLGFTTGIGGRGPWAYGYDGELNIPIGFLVNFHFYQLIADNVSRDIHADKLDLYFGANLGSGIAFAYYPNTARILPMAFGGLQFGLRYYFTPNVAVNGEFGWGKSIVNIGFAFKLHNNQAQK